MLLASICALLSTINIIAITTAHPDQSILNRFLKLNFPSPVLLVVKKRHKSSQNHAALRIGTESNLPTTEDYTVNVLEIDKKKPHFFYNNIKRSKELTEYYSTITTRVFNKAVKERNLKRFMKAENALNYLIAMLRVNANPVIWDLREKFKTLHNLITEQRFDNGCSMLGKCEGTSRRPIFRQKSNKEVFEYFKEHYLKENETDEESENTSERIQIKIMVDPKTEADSRSDNKVTSRLE